MPFGIQQPAVSGQLLALEKSLDVKLFNRRPFALTPEGEELYDFAYPFFSKVDEVEARIKGEDRKHLRLAASSAVLRTHLPELLEKLKVQEPTLKLTLKEAEPSEVLKLITDQQADIAITAIFGDLTEGLQVVPLMSFPLVLRVPESWNINSFKSIFRNDGMGRMVGRVPLVALPEHEILMRIFTKGLRKRGLIWDTEVEVGSLDIVQNYAVRGFGAGLGVKVPNVEPMDGLKELPVPGFDRLEIGLVWQGRKRPTAERFADLAIDFVEKLKAKNA